MDLHDDQLALFKYLEGRYLKGIKRYDEAIEVFESVLTLSVTTETYVKPHSYVEIAETYQRKGNNDKALELLNQFSSIYVVGFDLDKPLMRYVLLLKDRLEGINY
eukprot:TRINITY_DN11147_c0_g1_i1.p2 TRINITY_DN11147_c0_g1~~TRINITY_DN11147_c0_g1_i1.p2  ORF type:complete len:105 (-),score=8.50 TRINITY_DN11147_c0_g1_i1:69-383(-)